MPGGQGEVSIEFEVEFEVGVEVEVEVEVEVDISVEAGSDVEAAPPLLACAHPTRASATIALTPRRA
jgi:hypothetical protein